MFSINFLKSNDESGKDKEKAVDSTSTCLYYDVLTIMDQVFLPALSLSEGNCCLAEEIWSILRIYPYHCRYRYATNLHFLYMHKS